MSDITTNSLVVEVVPNNIIVEIETSTPILEIQPMSYAITTTIALPDLDVTEGIYGDAISTVQVEIDKQGRTNSISSIPIEFPVSSVNLQTGDINLTTLDIIEDTNLYYTDSRVRLNKLNQLSPPDFDLNLNNFKLTNVTDPANSQDAATKNYVDSNIVAINDEFLDFINNLNTSNIPEDTNLYYTDSRVRLNKLNQLSPPDSDLNLNNVNLTNLADPISSQDAATKLYVDNKHSSIAFPILSVNGQIDNVLLTTSDIVEGTNLYYTDYRVRLNTLNQLTPPDSDLNLNNVRLTNLADPINNQDAVTKIWTDTQTQEVNNKINQLTTSDISEAANLYYTDTRVRLNKLNQLTPPDSNLNLNNVRLTNLADPINNQDVVTKNYHQQNSISLGLVIALG